MQQWFRMPPALSFRISTSDGRNKATQGTMTLETDSRGGPSAGEAEIVRRAQRGDDSAFEELVSRHGKDLYRLAYFLTGQASDAEDVVQETFLGAYERIGAFEARSTVKTWLSRIL